MQAHDTATATKRCTKCGQCLPLASFGVDRKAKDGLFYWCRPCVAAQGKQWKAANRDRVLEQKRRHRLKYPGQYTEVVRQWKQDHPEQARANQRKWVAANTERVRLMARAGSRVQAALRAGVLTRPSVCEQCGASGGRIEAAHADYSKPLEVRWLCCPCHRRWDRDDPKTLH